MLSQAPTVTIFGWRLFRSRGSPFDFKRSALEQQLEREFHYPRIPNGAGDRSETRAGYIRIRTREIRSVERVEEFGPQFPAQMFRDRNRLAERKINVPLAWPAQDITSGITEQISGLSESGGVEEFREPAFY